MWQSDWALPNTEKESPESPGGASREGQALASHGCVVAGQGTRGQSSQGEFQLHWGNNWTSQASQTSARNFFTRNTQDSLAGKQPLIRGPFFSRRLDETTSRPLPEQTFPWSCEHRHDMNDHRGEEGGHRKSISKDEKGFTCAIPTTLTAWGNYRIEW